MVFINFFKNSIQEIRNKKECEIDIMESHINNIDEVTNRKTNDRSISTWIKFKTLNVLNRQFHNT